MIPSFADAHFGASSGVFVNFLLRTSNFSLSKSGTASCGVLNPDLEIKINFKMDGVIPFTLELREIVERFGWTFYQIPPAGLPWHEIEKRKPAVHLEVGHMCIFAPIPREGQSLREAYTTTQGLGPSLLIDPNWRGINGVYKGTSSIEREDEVLFSRIWFPNHRSSVLIIPESRENYDPSLVQIRMKDTVEAFRKYFRIVTPAEYGLPPGIPKPFNLRDN